MTTPEFRRYRARLAANTRHHPERTEDDRQLLNAASREKRLRKVLGPPPKGTTWIDQLRRVVEDCPPLTSEQREKLTLLLQPLPAIQESVQRSLFKIEFKEVQSYGGPVGRQVCAEWPPVIGVENAPGFEMSDRALDRGAQPVYLCIEFLLPVKQLPALRLLERCYEARALIALVADPAGGSLHDICGLCLSEGCHVVIVPGNGLGYEEEIAVEIRDGLALKSGCLMLSGPQFWCIAPGPGWRQEAVYQDRLLARGGFLRFLGGRPVLFGGRLDERRELRDYPGDYRLRRIEYFRPDFLGYVLSHIPACYNDGFSQGKVLRAPDSFMPRLFKLIFDALYQFVELL